MATPSPMSKYMAKQWQGINDTQIEDITERLKGNLELQMYVIGCIKDYEETKATASKDGLDMTSAAAAATASKRKKSGDSSVDYSQPPTGVAERYMHSWARWPAIQAARIIRFCEPALRDTETSAWKNKAFVAALLEYGWDLRICGTVQDKIYTTHLTELALSMRKAYDGKGQRLKNLASEIRLGNIDWTQRGFYKVRLDPRGGELKVFIKSTEFEQEVASASRGRGIVGVCVCRVMCVCGM